MQRGRAGRTGDPSQRFSETLRFLKHRRDMGAGGIQAPLASLDERYAAAVRERAAQFGIYVEVSARLPSNDTDDVELFEKTVRATKAARGSVIPTAMLSGRRFEPFKTFEDWKEFSRLNFAGLEYGKELPGL